jgi:hypothetical protein
MASISNTAITCAGLILGYYMFYYFHEYTHWVAGKLFSGNPNALYNKWYGIPYPYAVEYKQLAQMPDWGVRISGISPHLVWFTIALPYLVDGFSLIDADFILMINQVVETIHSTSPLTIVLITAATVAGVSVSPSDLVATFYPRKYREYTGRGFSHREWGQVLIKRVG